jgi:nanoRNase/pAp phosphatase (c-di-AMP/oligoRNAs hydrolase)
MGTDVAKSRGTPDFESDVTTPQEVRSESPSLLLMISDAAEADASARSAHREVRRWTSAATASSQSEFAGDPTSPETYAWIGGARTVTAVVHLKDDKRAALAVEALRKARPDSALLVLSEAVDHAPGDGTLTRAGELRDVLRLDLEDELLRLEAERRAWCLQQFVGTTAVVPIVIHADPDPDALSSALAARVLLKRTSEQSPIVTTRTMSRPENRRMADLIGIEVIEKTAEAMKEFDRVIVLDMQPSQPVADGPRLAVIDHHPPEAEYSADFLDVRPEYGAVATMLTEYLRASDPDSIDAPLATALLYGIRTDTDALSRGVTPADVDAYAFLQSKADAALLRRIERPSMPMDVVRIFADALQTLRVVDDTAFCYAGELDEDERHALADIADFCMQVEGVSRVVAVGSYDDQVILTLRHASGGAGVSELARALGEQGGSGGGHATMARAVVPVSSIENWEKGSELDAVVALVKQVQSSIVTPRSSGAHP